MANPTYPLDRRVLEIIMALTGTTLEVHLDEGKKATSSVYDDISAQVADGAWKAKLKHNPNAVRPREFEPLHRNTWKRLFGHANTDGSIMGEGSTAADDTTRQIVLFLGYERWEDFEAEIDEVYERVVELHQDVQGGVQDNAVVSVHQQHTDLGHLKLKLGDKLEVYWPKGSNYEAPGDAFMKIRYMGCIGAYGAPRFHINAVHNCSLKAGDDFDAHCLEEGEIARITIRRPNTPPDSYSSANAVTSIKVYHEKDC
jgi:hypothetical protein